MPADNLVRFGNRLHVHLGLLQRNAGLAGQDQQLAQHVTAAQVNGRIRLGIALLPGFLHNVREGNGAVIPVEQVAERSGDAGLDLLDPVAAVQHLVDRLEDRQGGARRGLIAQPHPGFQGLGLQGLILLV